MAAGGQLGVGLRSDALDEAVFDDNDRLIEDFIGSEEAARCQYRAHQTEYSDSVSHNPWG